MNVIEKRLKQAEHEHEYSYANVEKTIIYLRYNLIEEDEENNDKVYNAKPDDWDEAKREIAKTWFNKNDIDDFINYYDDADADVNVIDIKVISIEPEEMEIEVTYSPEETNIDNLLKALNNFYKNTQTEHYGKYKNCYAEFIKIEQ